MSLKGGELIKARKVERNMSLTLELLQQCLPVLRAYIKLQQQMSGKRYYPALKTLEQLEHIHLPNISQYRFCEHLKKSLSRVRESIKEASMTDLKDFLENIRKYSPKIGEVAMRHAAEQLNLDVTASSVAIEHSLNSSSGYEAQSESTYNVEEDLSAQDLVDFSPVYRCLHIHTVLDAQELYESYYRKQRKKQARLALQPPTNMHQTIDGYRQYFHGIVGFFVVEDHVMNTASSLVNRSYLDDVWGMAVSKISYCTDPCLMLKIKNLVMLFSSTLKVTTLSKYNEIIDSFPYRDAAVEAAPFPKKLPFSCMVPKVYQQVRNYIEACLQFTQDLNMSAQEVDDTLRRYTNLLLTRTLSGCLSTLIRKPSLSLLQLIQISINTIHLEQCNGALEDFIAKLTGGSRELSHTARLQGRTVFRDVRSDAEQQIYEALQRKMDEFMDLANYDWLLSEPSGQASSYLMDLIAFLHSTFQAFTNLPVSISAPIS
nr:EOG090X01NK [Leptodora kindtii]